MKIESRIVKHANIKWQSLKWFQDESFKEIKKDAFAKLKQSLINNSFIMPFNVWEDETGTVYILDGHHREKALKELLKDGYTIAEELPANFYNCSNREEAAKLVLIFTSQYANATEQGLIEFFKTNKLDFTNINNEVEITNINLNKIQLNLSVIDETKLDEVPPPPKQAISKTGDIYLLNNKHRVMCGDSTKKEDVELLMDGKKADMCFTDPDYSMQHNLLLKCYENEKKYSDKVSFWMASDKQAILLANADIKRFTHFFIHDFKCATIISNTQPMQRHTLILKFGNRPINNLKDAFTTIVQISSERTNNKIHSVLPMAKKVQLPETFIIHYTNINEIVLDLFLHGGSTLIAAEQLSRICYGMEIDPIYIDVILKRYYTLYPQHDIKCLNRNVNIDKIVN